MMDLPSKKAASRRFLFIHQNFPGQFVHVAKALARLGHEVIGLGITPRPVDGVRIVKYEAKPPKTSTSAPMVKDFEVKVQRGSACANAMQELKKSGFTPDTIVAHPGWGEALFCKDIWPEATLVVFAEFYYNAQGADFGFDPEFSSDSPPARSTLRLKNTALLHALSAADVIYAPTEWQKSQVPREYLSKIAVIHDGIDTNLVKPDPGAVLTLRDGQISLSARDEVITFVSRNLEPYRGFHILMRALPEILKSRPNAHCVIIGRDDVSYGRKPKGGGSWREEMLKEVGEHLPLGRVHFTGGLAFPDYLAALQVSSCHVYLSYPFVLSWSCLEAMSAGCVVVGSDTAPVAEAIAHGRTGLLTDFFDKRKLAASVCDVLADRDKHVPLRKAARNHIVNNYDLASRCLPGLLELLKVPIPVSRLTRRAELA